jgi:type IV pilus assembly protein PilX
MNNYESCKKANQYDAAFGMHRQKGIVLLVSLILVLLITVVGLAAIRGSGLQELMAGNMREHNLAFQAAEAGLRAAETTIRPELELNALPTFDDSGGHFNDLNKKNSEPKPPALWDEDAWDDDDNTVTTNMDLTLASDEQPRYVMERLVVPITIAAAADGSGIDTASMDSFEEPEFYRVTSRGTGGAVNAHVILQSVYKR